MAILVYETFHISLHMVISHTSFHDRTVQFQIPYVCHYLSCLCLADIWPIRCQPINNHTGRHGSKIDFRISSYMSSREHFPNITVGCHFNDNSPKWYQQATDCVIRMELSYRFLVSKETVVLRWWESETWKFGFIKRVDKGRIITVKDLESWRFER